MLETAEAKKQNVSLVCWSPKDGGGSQLTDTEQITHFNGLQFSLILITNA